jgi:hypothetical protein
MPPEPCTFEHHEQLRADPAQLRRRATAVQVDEHGEPLLALALCPRGCGSTLAVDVEEGVPIHVDDVL